ncbi:MAG: hypothetical protein RLZ98_1072 [Pseudomonadota bacterium]
MSQIAFMIGVMSALVLIPLLLKTAWESDFRIWPPAQGTWQSYTFWSLFRTINVTTIAAALLSVFDDGQVQSLGLPLQVRLLAFAVMLIALYGYVQSLVSLGKKNTYCDQDGLVTRGIYRWTRNPQYATIIPFYIAMALAADTAATYVLASAMCTVYYLMAMVEEPWLAGAYGKPYEEYCRRVPRFFNFRRAVIWVQAQIRRAQRLLSPG